MATSATRFLISRVASMPERSGRPISIKIRFGLSRRVASMASEAEAASPTISTSRSFSSSIFSPERTTAWSSTTNRRIVIFYLFQRLEVVSGMIGDQRCDFRTVARAGLHGDRSPQQRGAFFHTRQPQAGTAGAALLFDAVQIETDAVIPHVDADVFLLEPQIDVCMGCMRMFDDVVQGFLDDTERRDLRRLIQIAFFSHNIHADMDRRMLLNSACIPA